MLRALKGSTSALLEIADQLKRLADLYESTLTPSRSTGFKSFYQDKPGGESISYTNDAEMARRERMRDAYYDITGIRLEDWELPPLEALKDG